MPTIARDIADRISAHWLNAWNSHDARAVVEHFAEEVAVSSPLLEVRRPGSGGRLAKKSDVLDYYEEGLRRAPQLHFELVEVLRGVDQLTIVYRDHTGCMVAETLVTYDGVTIVAVNVSRADVRNG
jgi:hypothetical protein